MRVVLQRVTGAEVRVEDAVVGRIAHGLVALVGIGAGDVAADVAALAAKTAALRIFDTADGARSVGDVGGGVLVISQFTLLADTRRGNGPDGRPPHRPTTRVHWSSNSPCSLKAAGSPSHAGSSVRTWS